MTSGPHKGRPRLSLFTSISREMAVFDHIISYQGFDTEDERLDSILNLQDEMILFSSESPTNCEGEDISKMSTSEEIMWLYYEFIARGIDVKYGSKFDNDSLKGLHLARVSATMAGAGKRRLFVIANYGLQRLLRPFHDWFASVLRTLPSDGTFDQHKPILRVFGCPFVASFDLKAATDRWPRHLMTVVMCNLFGSRLAAQVTESCLGAIGVSIGPPVVKKFTTTANVVGTLLGYHCAWPLFALSHHVVVWCAAEAVYPGRKFTAYGILGDDVVLGDRRVAEEYRRMLALLGVKISESKSLVSDTGAFEFAKKYYLHSGSFDCSPVSLRACLLARSTLGLATIRNQYRVKLKSILRVGGAGYRVMSRLSPCTVKGRWSRLIIYLSYNSSFNELSLEWWFSGFTKPLNPYLKGCIVHWLLERVKPKQLTLPPHSAFDKKEDPELVLEYCEYTVTRSWCARWLRWLLWYSTKLSNNQGRLRDLLDAPVVETSWYRREIDLTVFRYGLIWRLYDMVKKMSSNVKVRALPTYSIISKEQLYYPVRWKLA